MVLLGDIPNQFASTVRSKCGEAYALLLKAARPILHYGSEEEVALHNYQADDSFIFTFNRVMQPWNLESIIVALAQLQHSRTLNTNHRRTGRFEIQPSLKKTHCTQHTAHCTCDGTYYTRKIFGHVDVFVLCMVMMFLFLDMSHDVIASAQLSPTQIHAFRDGALMILELMHAWCSVWVWRTP